MKRDIPNGIWIEFRNLPSETTAEDLQALIVERTGVLVELSRIVVYPFDQRFNGAKVSLNGNHVQLIMVWALHEDQMHGQPIQIKPFFSDRR
jgi:hypothetical protein